MQATGDFLPKEPVMKWEGHLPEAIGPFFKARALADSHCRQ